MTLVDLTVQQCRQVLLSGLPDLTALGITGSTLHHDRCPQFEVLGGRQVHLEELLDAPELPYFDECRVFLVGAVPRQLRAVLRVTRATLALVGERSHALTVGQRTELTPAWAQRQSSEGGCCDPFTQLWARAPPAVQQWLGEIGPMLHQANHPRLAARPAPPPTARTWPSSRRSCCRATTGPHRWTRWPSSTSPSRAGTPASPGSSSATASPPCWTPATR